MKSFFRQTTSSNFFDNLQQIGFSKSLLLILQSSTNFYQLVQGPCFGQKLFLHLQNGTRLKSLPCSFFGTVKLFRKFFHVSKDSPFKFLNILQQTGFSKGSKGPPFAFFGIVRIFSDDFCLRIRFSQWTSTLYPNYDRCFVSVLFSFSQICFRQSHPPFLQEMKRFASIEDSLGFLALCDIFWKKSDFLNVSSGGKVVDDDDDDFFYCLLWAF